MILTHTSPEVITEIKTDGLFDDCLFFSIDEYSMGDVKAVYQIEIKEENIINVYNLESKEIIESICSYLSVDADTAQELLNNELSAGSITSDYEDDWYIQAKQGECATLMGYEACESEDEQGAVYIVPMINKFNELKLTK